jgi:hypothetical protein
LGKLLVNRERIGLEMFNMLSACAVRPRMNGWLEKAEAIANVPARWAFEDGSFLQ